MLKPGRYLAEHDGDIFHAYRYVMEVKETDKSYIFKLLEVENKYACDQVETMFNGKDRIVLRKDKPSRHAMHIWSDHDFTLYPYRVGVPFYFELEENVVSKPQVSSPKYQEITIVSRIENDLQAWTFQIRQEDLINLIDRYGADGCSVRGSVENVADEIHQIYRKEEQEVS